MTRMFLNGLAALAPLIGVASCESAGCLPVLIPPVSIFAVDSVTSMPVTDGLNGEIREGLFVGTLVVSGNHLTYADSERPGTYDATVKASGYRDWIMHGVVVQKTQCGTDQATLTAKLSKL